jgi:tRNA 2-thiouridine synthesizing protein E
MRGACKIAGITYQDRIVNYYGGKAPVSWLKAGPEKTPPKPKEKIYPIDVFGFLVDFDAWDENYALNRAYEIDIELSDRHWELIYYLRDNFRKNNVVPTLYEFCESNKVELDELEKLFPKGYHRGLLKIAGLRVIG